jgi:Zn-dependent protease/CBS domain-containing protein
MADEPRQDRNQQDPNQHPISGTVSLGRLFGVPIRLHFTFLALLVFLLWIGIGQKQSGAATAIYILALFASVLLHEIGHTLVARHYGIRTTEIVMFPIGGVSRPEKLPKGRQELFISLAGPLVNALIAGGLIAWVAMEGRFQPIQFLKEPSNENLAERIAAGNLLLFLFNLLPAYPMDGGRILRAALALRMPENRATQIAATAGRRLAVAIILFGLLWGNFMLVFVGAFVYLGAWQEGVSATGRSLTSGFPVRSAMITDFRTLPHGATIRDAGNLLLSTSQHDFPVVHGEQVIGLLGRSALIRAMMSEGPEAYVSTAMDRNFLRVPPDADLSEVMPKLSAPGAVALVMDDEDRLLGLLTAENLSEFVLLRQGSLAHEQIVGPRG